MVEVESLEVDEMEFSALNEGIRALETSKANALKAISFLIKNAILSDNIITFGYRPRLSFLFGNQVDNQGYDCKTSNCLYGIHPRVSLVE